MRILLANVLVCFCSATVASHSVLGEQDARQEPRSDIYVLNLADGSELSIYAVVETPETRKTVEVRVARVGKKIENLKQRLIWSVPVTSFDYVPNAYRYYALVKPQGGRIFIFGTWNRAHVTIDVQNGQVIERGEGDDALKAYDALVPLKLQVCVPPAYYPLDPSKPPPPPQVKGERPR